MQYDTLFKDIACVLVDKCVNSQTNRPYTISMLERSLKDIHFAVDPKRGAKQQALEVRPRGLHQGAQLDVPADLLTGKGRPPPSTSWSSCCAGSRQ